jgi:endonuclease/exonuclease/phosphatase family metal-dependent hydrolase
MRRLASLLVLICAPGVLVQTAPDARARAISLAVPAPARVAQAPAQTTVATPSIPLKVMSFNIRYGTANDGDNHWTNRRAQLHELVRFEDADLIGLQEALDSQIREIAAAVPVYGVIGVGRDDARLRGEFSAILYRKDRFHVAESGTFWFSDTPAVPGSKTWGNNITRICSWARLIDRDGRAFYHFNVHLDHESQPSRERSTALLAQRVAARAYPNEPAIITGDFNVGEANPALTALSAPGPGGAPLFVDTYRVRFPQEKEVGTFNGFKMGATTGEKIDYVFVQPGTDVLSAAIVRSSRDGRYPSDHFPVTATVRWK